MFNRGIEPILVGLFLVLLYKQYSDGPLVGLFLVLLYKQYSDGPHDFLYFFLMKSFSSFFLFGRLTFSFPKI